MKSTIITTRIAESFKEDLEILGGIKNMKLSQMTRIALENYYNNVPIENVPIVTKKEVSSSVMEDSLLQSLEFTELISWIYDKIKNPGKDEINEFYEQHINLINDMQNHPRFHQQILNEFNKVRDELRLYLKGDFQGDKFNFSNKFYFDAFNYDALKDFMYTIRYNKNGSKELFIK